MDSNDLEDPTFVESLRRQMLRFAQLQLGDISTAEDAVQEALVGALKNRASFSGRSAFKTWVFAILKNKVTDLLRSQQRWVSESSLEAGDEVGDAADRLFDRSGHWHKTQRPRPWAEPEGAMEDQHFWRAFEACLDHLPARQARVFMLREFMGFSTEEICKTVALSVTNLHVLLHRARLRLRQCLEDNWFYEG